MRLCGPVCIVLFAVALPMSLLAAPKPTTVKKATPRPPALTEATCREWGRQIEETVGLGDPTFFRGSFDYDGMSRRFDWGNIVDPAMRRGVLAGMKETGLDALVDQICALAKKGGSYKCLRVRESGGQWSVLFRMNGPQGINYHDYLLKSNGKGGAVAVDIFIASSAEWLSQSLPRVLTSMVSDGSSLSPEFNPLSKVLKDFKTRSLKGDPEAAEELDRMPARFKREKWFMLLMLANTSSVKDPERYKERFEEFQRAYPTDPALHILSLDYYLAKKDYGKCVNAVNHLKEFAGDDPYLDYITALLQVNSGDQANAMASVEKAIAANLNMKEAFVLRFNLCIQAKDHAKGVATLDILETQFGMQFANMKVFDTYPEFAKSPEFEAWRKRHEPAPDHP